MRANPVKQKLAAGGNAFGSMIFEFFTPHALCWTDELFGNIARTSVGAVLSVHAGRRPQFVVDAAALSHPRVKAWLR